MRSSPVLSFGKGLGPLRSDWPCGGSLSTVKQNYSIFLKSFPHFGGDKPKKLEPAGAAAETAGEQGVGKVGAWQFLLWGIVLPAGQTTIQTVAFRG